MKRARQRHWLPSIVFVLCIVLLPHSGLCQKASIQGVSVEAIPGGWSAGFHVENCFTEKMEEAIRSGIRTVFTFYLHVEQKRKWWKDRKLGSLQFHHVIQYDPIRGEYHVTLEEKGSTQVTSDLREAKRWMATVEAAEIRLSSPMKSGMPLQLRVKAQLNPVRLPLHLEYLFFFVSLWDVETDWLVQPLPP